MTAHAMKGDRERCLEAGMDGYLSKPVTSKELGSAISKALGSLSNHHGRAIPRMRRDPRSRVLVDFELVLERFGGDEKPLAVR